jgi:DNA-binding NarL/FixJ family response regulator
MRVVLVGTPVERDRLRRSLTADTDVAGEAATLGAARALDLDVDGYLVAPRQSLDASDREVVQEPLTPRELDVLELLAEGLPNKAIADRLGISDQTVKFHVAAICGKLGASNRTDAVRRAVRRGLIAI